MTKIAKNLIFDPKLANFNNFLKINFFRQFYWNFYHGHSRYRRWRPIFFLFFFFSFLTPFLAILNLKTRFLGHFDGRPKGRKPDSNYPRGHEKKSTKKDKNNTPTTLWFSRYTSCWNVPPARLVYFLSRYKCVKCICRVGEMWCDMLRGENVWY